MIVWNKIFYFYFYFERLVWNKLTKGNANECF